MGVIISCHDISIPTLLFHRSDYIMPRYIHLHSLGPCELLYRATIYPPPLSRSMGVIALCRSISTPLSSCMGITMIIMPWCLSTLQKIWDWLWWHYIFTPDKIWWGGEYIVNHIFIPDNIWRGWLYRDIIFPLLTIFGEGGDYVVAFYFHSWQYLVRRWLYRNIFSLLTVFGEGMIIVWHYIFIPDTPLDSGNGGDYIWIFSLSKFDSAVIPGFIIIHIHIFTPWNLGDWSDYIFSMIPSLLLKRSVSGGYVDGLYQQSMMNKDYKRP